MNMLFLFPILYVENCLIGDDDDKGCIILNLIVALVCYCFICRSVPDTYADQLVEEGVMEREEVNKITGDHMTFLTEQFKLVDSTVPKVLRSMPYPFLMMQIEDIMRIFTEQIIHIELHIL